MQRSRIFIPDSLKSGCLSSRALSLIASTKPGTNIKRGNVVLLFIAIVLMLCIVAPSAANAKTATLAWDANEEPDLEGYVVYRNTGSPGPPYKYSDEVPEENLVDPLHPQAKLTGLQEGKQYYVALTAYNTDGVESNFSNDVCVEVVDGAIETCTQSVAPSVSTRSNSSGSGGGGGGGCFIKTAETEASLFSQWIGRPVIWSQLLAMLLVLLVLTVAVKLVISRSKKEISAL